MQRLQARLPLLVTLLALAALPACREGADKPTDPATTTSGMPVLVETVARGDVVQRLDYVASLLPSAEVRIFSPVPDRVLSFSFEDGDEVAAGDVIALIRREGMAKGLDQIAAQIEALNVQVANLASERERSERLFADGVITRQALDQVRTSHLAALAQRKSLQASRDQLAVTVGDAAIKAPIAGVIAGKSVQAGDMAVPQLPLCRVMVVDPLQIDLRLIEADVSLVKLGMQVEVTLDAWPGRTFTGTLTRVLPYLDPATRTNTAEVTLPNPVDAEQGGRLLKPGMYGRAQLVVGRHTQVVVAPEHALLLDNDLAAQPGGRALRRAFVVEPGDGGDVARTRVVRIGARQGDRVEVVEGLAEGERLVVRGQHGLEKGRKVKVIETRSK